MSRPMPVHLALLATSAVPVAGGGCGQTHTSGERKVPLASMRSEKPLYVMESSGRLVRMDLRSCCRH